jgi:hypothetical protein
MHSLNWPLEALVALKDVFLKMDNVAALKQGNSGPNHAATLVQNGKMRSKLNESCFVLNKISITVNA